MTCSLMPQIQEQARHNRFNPVSASCTIAETGRVSGHARRFTVLKHHSRIPGAR